jgi:hypothetical protein
MPSLGFSAKSKCSREHRYDALQREVPNAKVTWRPPELLVNEVDAARVIAGIFRNYRRH